MMSRSLSVGLLLLVALLLVTDPDAAHAGRGGGGGARGGGGGGFRPSGGGNFGGYRRPSSGFSRELSGGASRPAFDARQPNFDGLRSDGVGRLNDGFDASRPRPNPFDNRRPAGANDVSDFLGLPRDGAAVQRNPFAATDARNWDRGYAGSRATWSDLSREQFSRLQDNLHNAVRPSDTTPGEVHRWNEDHPERAQDWKKAGDQVRQNWNDRGRPGNDWWRNNYNRDHRPGDDWWSRYHPDLHHWYYHHDWHHHDWWYWWGYTPWNNISPWFNTWGWNQPIYYDYGSGGNVVFQNNNVYVNGQNVGSAEDYADSAADLASVDPSLQSSDDNSWLPLGTFAFVTNANDPNPTRILQLAVDRQGIVSGTLHNDVTQRSYVVQGRVDRQSQRVAFTLGSNSDVVVETGIYNLTQDQTPVLVHYGDTRTEQYLLVRLNAPPQDETTQDNPLGGAFGPQSGTASSPPPGFGPAPQQQPNFLESPRNNSNVRTAADALTPTAPATLPTAQDDLLTDPTAPLND